jgi:hypothetical protein
VWVRCPQAGYTAWDRGVNADSIVRQEEGAGNSRRSVRNQADSVARSTTETIQQLL